MNKSLPIICLCLVFTALLSCNRPDLTDEIWNAYHSVSKDSDDSGSECIYGDYTCRYGDSYYCRYDGSWEYYETCDYGCSYSTGRCDSGGSDGGYDNGGNNGYDNGNDYSDTGDYGDTEEWGDTEPAGENEEENYSEDYCPGIEGYTWSPEAGYETNWQSALDYCENLDKCGYSDWRLPSISELRLLIQNCSMTEIYGDCGVSDDCLDHPGCENEACGGCEYDASGYYSKLGDHYGWFWSSSLRSDDSIFAWGVRFFNGLVTNNYVENDGRVRCVR